MIALRAERTLAEGRELRDVCVIVDGDRVVEVSPVPPAGVELVELGEADLVPGLVDLHSDCLEIKARPRQSMELPLQAALLELDAEVAAWGITTHFLCVCLEDDLGRYRSLGRARDTVAVLERLRPALRVDHRVHLRIDVTGDGQATAEALAASPALGLLSYMVHLPGLGQFRDEATWRRYYTTVEAEGETIDERLSRRMGRLDRIDATRAAVAGLARTHGVALASHDDESLEAVDRARSLGVAISEFPVTLEAARAAHAAGLHVVMGAPNARSGGSHHGNVSARQALAEGCLSALASDYHPPSLMGAAYALADVGACSWAEALGLVTEGPARAAGLADRGSIRAGARADLVAVRRRAGLPAVARTWVAGQEVC
jgi:alpha-D-ribose 1-methylphosphonate 5-triphosphate diphosphatase